MLWQHSWPLLRLVDDDKDAHLMHRMMMKKRNPFQMLECKKNEIYGLVKFCPQINTP